MPLLQRFQSRTAWLMLCVMLLGAAAPAISRMADVLKGRIWVEVCSSTGSKWVAMDTGEELPSRGGHDAHCAFCVLQADQPLVLSELPPLVFAEFECSSKAPGFSPSSLERIAFLMPLCRAPPFSSALV